MKDMPERINSSEKLSNQDEILMSPAALIQDDDRIPPGYSLYRREARLLNGRTEPVFYSTREDQVPDPDAWERSSSSIIDGFVWALKVEEFADHETEDDDRTQEIGNMMSYALSQGLTEEQTLECYKQAFVMANEPAQKQS